jgi:hypothetical protein
MSPWCRRRTTWACPMRSCARGCALEAAIVSLGVGIRFGVNGVVEDVDGDSGPKVCVCGCASTFQI